MAGSSCFRRLRDIAAAADLCEPRQLSTREGIEELRAARAQRRLSRREFLTGAGQIAAGLALAGMAPVARGVAAPAPKSPISVGIVGAGLAGLACAYELKRKGVSDAVRCQPACRRASASRGVITDYSSGKRGAALNPNNVQNEANAFLNDLDNVFPGALASVRRDPAGNILAHLEHWPSNPLFKGSYTCYRPGQFTSIAGNEGTPVRNLYFAGEHANSFDEWQGFMEGAALSGIQAATQILQDAKAGRFG